jgi:hypothetical protein
MPRSVGSVVQNAFVNGLVTEATALNFPENAVTDTLNCVYDEKGNVTRRLGIDWEKDTFNFYIGPGVVSTFLWENVAGDGDLSFAVAQHGSTLYLYRVEADGALASNVTDVVGLGGYKLDNAPEMDAHQFGFAYGNGYLFVTHPYMEPVYLSYDRTTETCTVHTISILTRDFKRFVTEEGITGRPTEASPQHLYNLYNQGWNPGRVEVYTLAHEEYPANNEVWWLYKNSLDQFHFFYTSTNGQPSETPVEGGGPKVLRESRDRGNSYAPNGHYVVNPFDPKRTVVSGIVVDEEDEGEDLDGPNAGYHRPSTVEFYSGRVFYSGVQSETFGNKIFFSRILDDIGRAGDCYQENDPTSEYSFELLPTDGGVISIPEAGQIIRLFSIEGALVVFASNGVWQVTGSTGIGFTADDYVIKRVSTVPCLSTTSFVDVNGMPTWWNTSGIYVLEMNSALGTMQVISAVDKKIKSWFDKIPPDNKKYAKGVYNPLTRVIQWLYHTEAGAEPFTYNAILNFNVISGAFYPWKVEHPDVTLRDIVVVKGIDENGGLIEAQFKYYCSWPYDDGVVHDGGDFYAFAILVDEEFSDFRSHGLIEMPDYEPTGPVDFDSYFVSGYMVHGEAHRKFQVNYMSVYADTSEQKNTFTVQALWDYATNSIVNRWSTKQTVNLTSGTYSARGYRMKLRGHGKACQIKIASVGREPFNVIGWSLFESVNASV